VIGNAFRKGRPALVVLAAIGLAAAGIALANPASAATVIEVKGDKCRATGDGTTNDTAAINRCINLASGTPGGAIVHFEPGTYRSANSIHMKDNVTLDLDAAATIMGASGTGYDAPEPNAFDNFQDFGHSHFHDAMIWGNNLSNIGFTGDGTIDGGGHLITGNPSSGQADKIISLTLCKHLTMNNIRLRRGGHFAALINGCDDVHSDALRIDTASDRDGWNIISTTNVTITNPTIAANDDALVFKSDFALGAKMPNGPGTVTGGHLSAKCCNALMFGSETCGDFTNYKFTDITITGANKSGLGLVSMDGAHISNVVYQHIRVTGVSSPIMQKIGTRRRCGNNPGIGLIDHITYDDIEITGKSSPQFSPTLWGETGGNRISDVTFNNVRIHVPGGHDAMGTGVPSNDPNNYNPNSIGTRPAYGWYIHNANNIQFTNSTVDVASGDARPAVIANTGSSVKFDTFTAERSTGSTDMLFQTETGFCVSNSKNTSGGALRVSQTGSTQNCTAADDFSVAVSPASQTVPSGGGTATYTVQTSVVSGTPGAVTLSATGAPAGATVTFGQNPVPAGGSTTMTVTTTAATPDGTSTITVRGTAGSTTHTATTSLTVGTGGALTLSNLSVADTANAADWSLQTNLRTGVTVYGDRAYTVASVPAALQGKPWVRTANDSKASTANPLATFTINRSATVAVCVDTRVGRPSWIDSTWADSGTTLTTSEGGTTRTFRVFQKSFAAGQVAVGPNGSTGSMYTVAVF
jgi:polygalacturonase